MTGRSKAIAALTIVCVGMAALVALPVLAQPAEGEVFFEEGDITGSNPGSSGVGGASENEFTRTCNPDPASEGADGWIVEFPESFQGSGAAVKVFGTSPGPYNLDIAFYDGTCSYISQSVEDEPDEATTIAEGAVFAVVNQALGADTHICLVAGVTDACPPEGGEPEPSESPTGEPSPSESPSESPTGEPEPSESPTGEPTPKPSPSEPPEPARDTVWTTIETNRERVSWGRSFELSGIISADDTCATPFHASISRKVLGKKKWNVVARDVPVDKRSRWSLNSKSEKSAKYRAKADGAGNCARPNSGVEKVFVRAKVTLDTPLRCGSDRTVEGAVRPGYPGSRVLLQRRQGGSWTRIDSDSLNKKARFRLEPNVCSGQFRVKWLPGQRPNLVGFQTFQF